ncbi:hypothetical protein B0H10DRAFT_1774771, partial [Mycena sp. CBHHK59/15]
TGHGLCIVCSERTHSKPRCAICRHPKGSLEPVQIYLTFGESTPADKAKSVADNLGRIDADSLPVSVQKAGRKIRHVMRDIQPDDAIARELLDAAKNLDERIYPLFLELDLANDRIAALNAEIQELRRQLTAAESRADEIKQIRRTLAETKECVLKEQGQNSRLSRTVQRQLADLETKEQENTQLLAKVTKREKRILLLEKKLKILSRVAKHPKPDADDPDESLQVENFAAVGESFCCTYLILMICRVFVCLESPVIGWSPRTF